MIILIITFDSLLNNCETWIDINEETVNKLEDLQFTMYRTLLSTPKSTPPPALCWDFGSLSMKFRIIKKKLLFIHHVINMDETALAKQIQNVQQKYFLPGLTKECQSLIYQLNLPNIFDDKVNLSKHKWKILVKKKIKDENEKYLKELMNDYKKLKNSKLIGEKFETKDYIKDLTVEEARAAFKHRTSMTRYTKFNYKNDPLYSRQLWKCESCDNISTESHILWCSGFKHLREGLDLKSDKDLAKYLLDVVNIRSKN